MKTPILAHLKAFSRISVYAFLRRSFWSIRQKRSIFLISFLLFLFTVTSSFAAWVPGYTYKSKITIHGSQVCGSTSLVNFPMLVQLTGDFLKPDPAGLINSANGYDIIFTASDELTVLDHQIDHYNSATGEYSAWVKIPSLPPGADLDLYMYYGNSAIVADPSTSNTWSGNFNTVYHFQNNNFNDATANAINSINNGTTTTSAKIGDGRDLDGTAAYVQSSSNILATSNNFTISVWFKADATTPGHIIWQGQGAENGWGNGGASGQEMNLSTGTCCPSSLAQNDFVSYFLGDREEQASTDVLSAEIPFTNTTTWQYAVATVSNLDTSPEAQLFLNGTLVSTNSGVANALTARNLWDTNLRIGRPGAAARFFNGQVDEVRISTAVRSVDWVCTEYNNQNDPTGFFSLVNHPPDLTAVEPAALNYSEGNAATAITSTLTAADWDNAAFTGATIQITGNYQNTEDVLAFTNAFGITGVWNSATGTLTLTGTATIANYQAALRSLTYQNTNTFNPSVLARTITFIVNDGTDNSTPVTRNISVAGVNDAPQLGSIEATSLAYSEGQAATAITSSVAIIDDNANIASATVRITANYLSTEDILAFTNAFGITGTFNSGTGTMTLTGSSSLANYEAALRSVTYRNSNNAAPSTLTRTVSFTVNDGALGSNTVTRTITVSAVNDAPVLGAIELAALNYAEGAVAAAITSAITITDVDNANITGATIQITGNYLNSEDVLGFVSVFGITGTFDAPTGTMSLTGTTTLVNYRTALRSVTYQNTNTNNPSTLARTVSFTVTDGTDASNTAGRNINVSGVNDAPVLAAIEVTSVAYSEGQAATIITSTTTVADVDNANIASATVRITGNYANGQDVLAFTNAFGITGTFTAATGTLALLGSSTIANYQAALQSVTYVNTNNNNPSALTRTVTFTVNDATVNSNSVTRTITFTPVNDAPVLALTELTSLPYSEGQVAISVTSATTVADVDNATITGATIQITGNYASTEDVLSYVNTAAITGAFNPATGTMTLTGTTTLGNYQTALRAIRYQNTNTGNPSALTRTVSYTVTDGTDNSNTVSRNIAFTATNDTPVLAAIEPATLAYSEGQVPTVITSTITVSDIDNINIASATARVTGNYANGQDILAFTNTLSITATFAAVTGTLTLTGSATLAEYETALRSITYENTNNANPSALTRTITFTVNDGTVNSNTQTRTITFTVINDAPVLAAIEATDLAYSEGQAATNITTTTTVSDGDNANLMGAVIQITGNFVASEDLLSFANAFGVTGSYNAATATMTLSGNTSKANYQSAIRTVRYRNTNNATPSPLTRIVSYTVSDGSLSSNTVTRNITVTPVDDAPTVVNDPVTTTEETAVVINVLANDSDVDDAIDPTTVVIVTAPLNGTTSVDAVTGQVTYTPNLDFSGSNFFTYTVKDLAGTTSLTATVTITVANINDPPVFTAGTDIKVNEDAGLQTIVGWATGMDDGDPFTPQSLTFVIVNSNGGLFSSGPSINATTGTLTFTAKNNASGTATITVTLRDNGSSTAPNVNISGPQTFTITVLPVNDAPTAVEDFYSTSSNTPITANARSNDSDLESNTITMSTTPVVNPAFGTVVISSNGNFTYTPNGSFTGTDTFTYQICDDGTDNGVPASRCSQAIVSITINPPNTFFNIVGNNSIEISSHCFILTKALNNQQGAVWNRVPLDIRYSFELNFTTMFSDTGVVHDDGADGIIFALQRDTTPPPLNVTGSPIDARGSVGEFLGVGGVSPSIGIEVDTYQNGGEPVFDHIAISKNGSVYNIIAPPVPAKVDGSNNPLDIEDGMEHAVKIAWDKPTNTLRVFFDGEERTNFSQNIVDSIFGGDPTNIYWGFSASTGGKNNYQGVCGIDMLPINLPAVAVDDASSTNEDVAFTGTLLTNDSDPEQGSIAALAETKATTHGNVVINTDGTFTYTPVGDYNGTDSFTYQVCDAFATLGCATGTMNITILPTSDDPVATADVFAATEDVTLNIAATGVLANDTDADGDAITSSVVSTTTHGTLTLNPDGSFSYVPAADFNGSDSFSYRVSDGVNNSNTVTVSINVSNVNDAPVAINDDAEAIQDTNEVIHELANDTDIDNALDVTSVAIVSDPLHGTVSVDGTTGDVTYHSDAGYLGADAFTYTVEDLSGAVSNVATVNILVVPPNQPPVAVDDGPVVHTSLLPFTIDVMLNDSDPDNTNDELTLVSVTQPNVGSVSIVDGQIVYTPSGTEQIVVTFTYTISDPEGLTDVATVTINYAYEPLTVSEGFSPNGDNNNDIWFIRSIESYPNNAIKVFDRWGILVYQVRRYDNLSVFWDGRANTGIESGKLLEQGTYYFTVDLGNNSKVMSGFVAIVR